MPRKWKDRSHARERFGYDAWALIYDADTVRIVAAYPFECRLEGIPSRTSPSLPTPR